MENTSIETGSCEKTTKSCFCGAALASMLMEVFFIVMAFWFFFAIANKWIFAGVSGVPGHEFGGARIVENGRVSVGNVNFLVMGVDSVDGTFRSDTIFVMGVNPARARVSMLSIPRDTRVVINGRSRKINEILPRYGESVLRSLIEDLLNIRISRYVQVDFQGFINIVDILNGIDIDIERPMNYDDYYGKVHIHFKAGPNRLDGRQALNYVRFRADALADLGRIKRQQKFMRLLVEKLFKPATVVKLPQIIAQAIEHVKTDLTVAEVFTLVNSFDSYNVRFQNASLPGEARYINKISYFLPFSDKAVEIGAGFFSDFSALELVASFSSVIASDTTLLETTNED